MYPETPLLQYQMRALLDVVSAKRGGKRAWYPDPEDCFPADPEAFPELRSRGLVQNDPEHPDQPDWIVASPAGEALVDQFFELHKWEDDTSQFDPRGRSTLDGYTCTYRCWVPRGLTDEQIEDYISLYAETPGLYWPDPTPGVPGF